MERKNTPKCLCGCGKYVKRSTIDSRIWNKFLPGHNLRIPLSKKTEEERRQKISQTMKRRLQEHPEEIEKRKKTWTGRRHSEESKKIMSEKAVEREKIKKENGYVISEETKKKISLALRGRKFTKETLKKIGKANKGKIRSEDLRKQISRSLKKYYRENENPFKGKKHSEESKKRMSSSLKGKYTKEKASNWRGGISSYPYDISWDEELRKMIKNRDGNKCQNPACQNPYKILDVHHIDYDKKNCNPNNLITICKRCHGKTQRNREYWKGYYKALIKKLEGRS